MAHHRHNLFSAYFLLGTAALILPLHPVAAQTTVIGLASAASTAESNAATAGVPSFSLGFEFTANSAVAVTSLGYFYDPTFNPNADPKTPYTSFTSPHQVGLYQVVPGTGTTAESGTLLTQASVTTSSIQDGSFLYTSITPFALVPGTQYVIAGVTGATDPYLYTYVDVSGNSGITVDPAITYGQNRYAVSNTLAYAGDTDSTIASGFFGPNFQISNTLPVSAAPEPSQFAILGFAALGLGTLVLRVRRRRANAAL